MSNICMIQKSKLKKDSGANLKELLPSGCSWKDLNKNNDSIGE